MATAHTFTSPKPLGVAPAVLSDRDGRTENPISPSRDFSVISEGKFSFSIIPKIVDFRAGTYLRGGSTRGEPAWPASQSTPESALAVRQLKTNCASYAPWLND